MYAHVCATAGQVDPGADASIGGMAGTSASGTNAVRYGSMRENVLGLEVVLPSGEVLQTQGPKGRALKTAAGYNLTNLFVGSEGTLGVISGVTVRLAGRPAETVAAVCSFETCDGAVRTAMGVVQSGLTVSRMELLDSGLMGAVSGYAAESGSGITGSVVGSGARDVSATERGDAARPTLFLEVSGPSTGAIDESLEFLAEVCSDNGGGQFRFARETGERERLWSARHNLWYAALSTRPGCKGLSTDVAVPISRLSDVIAQAYDIEQDMLDQKLPLHLAGVCGHVGDGNFHSILLIDQENSDEVLAAREFGER